jgi:hypothetical protein
LYPPFTCLTCEGFEIKNGVKYLAVRASVSTARPDVSSITTVTSKMPSKDNNEGSDNGASEEDADSNYDNEYEDDTNLRWLESSREHDQSPKYIPSSVRCKNSHQMVEVAGGVHRDYGNSATAVGCDYCHSGYTLQDEPLYYHCEECKNFDCCLKCGPKCMPGNVQCKAKHSMIEVVGGVHRDYNNTGGVGCDYCHSGYTLQDEHAYYHCEMCKNFDCCLRCAPKYISEKLENAKIKIPYHSCELTLIDNPYGSHGYRCDGCSNGGKGFVYHCQSCGFDVHPICAFYSLYDRLPESIVVSSHPHVLKFSKKKTSWFCDGRHLRHSFEECSKSHDSPDVRYRCDDCDYDHCASCACAYFISAF